MKVVVLSVRIAVDNPKTVYLKYTEGPEPSFNFEVFCTLWTYKICMD